MTLPQVHKGPQHGQSHPGEGDRTPCLQTRDRERRDCGNDPSQRAHGQHRPRVQQYRGQRWGGDSWRSVTGLGGGDRLRGVTALADWVGGVLGHGTKVAEALKNQQTSVINRN